MKIWPTLVGADLLTALAVVLIASWTPSFRSGRHDLQPLHPSKVGATIAPCGDFFPGCLAQWRATKGLSIRQLKAPDLMSGQDVVVEKSGPGRDTFSLPIVAPSDRIQMDTMFTADPTLTVRYFVRGPFGETPISLTEAGFQPDHYPAGWKRLNASFPAHLGPQELVIELEGSGRLTLQYVALRTAS